MYIIIKNIIVLLLFYYYFLSELHDPILVLINYIYIVYNHPKYSACSVAC